MTLQFHCPHCNAVVRVADKAAGKRGTCPACHVQLLVPELPVAAASETGHSPAGSPATFPEGHVPTTPPPFVTVSDHLGSTSSIARTLKARKQRGLSAFLVPSLFLAIMGGVAFSFYWINRPTLDGRLSATVQADFSPAPRGLELQSAGVGAQLIAEIAQALKDDPIRISSPIMHLSFVGTGKGVLVSIQDGTEVDFYAIRIDADPDLRRFYVDHGEELEADRLRELKQGITTFAQDWREHGQKQLTVQRLMEYRDAIGINSLVNGMGYHLVAIAGKHIYPCVYEDLDGVLYFLLPPGTREFKVEGRQLPDGRQLIPANYTVTVSPPAVAPAGGG